MKICNQTEVVEIDNSAQVCEKFISTDCIKYKNAIAYLGIVANANVTELFEALLSSLIDARNTIALQDIRITDLENA